MPIFEHGEIKIEVDEDGFMQEPELWNEEVAKALATTEGVDDLTDEHWKLVNYLREYYLKFGIAPMIRKLCKETGFPLKKVYELFPSGPAKGACKVAGLAHWPPINVFASLLITTAATPQSGGSHSGISRKGSAYLQAPKWMANASAPGPSTKATA